MRLAAFASRGFAKPFQERLGICLLAAGLISAPCTLETFAQDAPAYRSIPLGEDFKTERLQNEKRKLKKDMLKGNAEYDQEFVKKYFRQYTLPKLTQLDRLEEINAIRAEIFDDLHQLRGEKAKPEARAHYTKDILIVDLSSLAMSENFHPTARINALLILGQLDTEPGSKTKLPVPASQAMVTLVKVIKEPKSSDAVVAAALVGIERHVQISSMGWKDSTKSTIAKELVRIFTTAAPSNRSPQVHSILQRKCLAILSNFTSSDHDAAKAFALSQVANVEADSWLRYECIRWIGSMDAIDASVLGNTATGLAEYAKRECVKWSADLDTIAGGGGSGGNKMSGMGMPGMGMPGGMGGPYGGKDGGGKSKDSGGKKDYPVDTQSAEVRNMRRRMNQLLDGLHYALDSNLKGDQNKSAKTGLIAVLKGNELQPNTEGLLEKIVALQKAVNNDSITDAASLKSKTKKSLKALIEFSGEFPGVDKIDGESSAEEEAAVTETPETPTPGEETPNGEGDGSVPPEGEASTPTPSEGETPTPEGENDANGAGN